MSFNTNDNIPVISRSNYEEYFLLYVDNELSAEEKVAVENFLLAHPDLQPEIDILLSTKLPFETINLADKESLMAESMSINTIDESLLLYIDNELASPEKEKLEGRLKADAEFNLQHQALLQTKLDPAEVISYPDKKELYRHTEKRILPYWMRAAAAAILILGIGTLAILNRQESAPAVAITKTPARPVSPAQQPEVTEPAATPALAQGKEIKLEKKDEEKMASKEHTEKTATQALAKRETPKPKSEPAPIVNEPATNNLPKVEEPLNAIAAADPVVPPKQTINTQAVTSTTTTSYNHQETALKTAEQRDFLAEVDNDKKASLKGFLRKATRFIERRTNIKATNENDELLIGAVALKL